MGDWAADLDGDFKILGPTWVDNNGNKLTSPELAALFDEHFDDMVETRFGDDAANMLALVFDMDTDAYQAVADAFEHAVRSGKSYFGIRKVDE